ncbi:class I adenylate-forming enzyme family protein [Kordiimonas sp.]|uniref:class I adenylate-forming enzyme family protein n=1 Tax=Kordiimonas sp. TaxID=1970157 RepID=UPI003A948BF1
MAAFDTSAPLLPEILSLHGKWKAGKAALICGDEVITWADFEARTNQLANALRAEGLGRGKTIGVVMSNGTAMVEALIAIIKSGACSVPINLSVTDEALGAMLHDADVSAVITTADQKPRIDAYLKSNPALFTLDASEISTFSKDASSALPDTGITGDDPLNIIYSSGTTGMPKGILHTHAGRRDWAYDLTIALRYHSAAKTLFTIGLYSNISWVGMLCTLLSGGTMVVAPKFDAREALSLIETHSISHFAMVPIQYQRLMEVPDQADFDLSSVEAVMSCGSPLHADLKSELFKRLGPKAVIELFGLTEGVITTLDPEEAEGRMASVGKPLVGTDIKIIGDDDKEVAHGQSGEIVGCGRIVMPGYLNRPDATAEATWVDEHGKAWLRTGDIGQLDDEGYLYIVDRKKDMILSGGQNIYPQDIEAVLITHAQVNDVAVIGVASERWGETPVAVVVPEAGVTLDTEALIDWANGKLGKQQRISGVILCEALPRNANGKILKRELRETYGG